MHEQLQALIAQTRKTLGLNNHILKRHNIFQEVNAWCETVYLLSMEWFPEDAVITDEDLNPGGTASVDIDLITNKIRSIIFVEDFNTADTSIYPKQENKNGTISWIETITGLTYGQHFIRDHNTDDGHNQQFTAAAEQTHVHPGGNILLKFNHNGILTVFDINGVFPDEDQIISEPLALKQPQYESAAKASCRLFILPNQAKEAWVPVYGIQECYLTNDGQEMIPLDYVNCCSRIKEDIILEWDTPLYGHFTKQAIQMPPEVTLETALANQSHPDACPLTNAEVTACNQEVLRFMRLVYPNDSSKWRLMGMYLDNRLIIAEIVPAATAQNILNPKIKLIIKRDTLTAINYVDQTQLYDKMFESFTEADQPVLSHTDAFNMLQGHLETNKPVYVRDSNRSHYIKCAKIDCAYGVNAVTGELLDLADS